MEREIHRVLIGRERIATRVAQIGRAIAEDLAAEPESTRVVLVPILTGSMVFVADLIRHIPLKMSIRPVTLSSYPGAATQSQGVTLRGEIPTDLADAHVIVIDDILDSGRTLGLLKRMIQAQRPASVRLCVLLSKRKSGGRDEHVTVDYAGFEIDDEFVVGYGLDYDGYFRNLPDIVTLRLDEAEHT
jgi:hypoxanthine phosphoribosyltransferase